MSMVGFHYGGGGDGAHRARDPDGSLMNQLERA